MTFVYVELIRVRLLRVEDDMSHDFKLWSTLVTNMSYIFAGDTPKLWTVRSQAPQRMTKTLQKGHV